MTDLENKPVNDNEDIKDNKEPALEVKEDTVPEEKVLKANPDDGFDLVKYDNPEEVTNQVESKRTALLALFKKNKKISSIMMGVVAVVAIGAIVMIFNDLDVLRIVGYSLAGAVLLAMIVYYAFTKNKFPNASKIYIEEVTDIINGYNFNDKDLTDVKVFPKKKLTKMDLEVDRVYKNALEIGSRNYIAGKYKGHNFNVSENVLYSLSATKKNQREVLFLGKYISFENNFKFEGRYIFNLKGNPEKLVDQPNDLEDLKLVEDGNVQVYAPNDKAPKDVLGTKFLAQIKEIRTDEKLLNAVVVVWAGHTGVYLSYDDSVTVLPFEHPFDRAAQEQYKEDLVAALELSTLKK